MHSDASAGMRYELRMFWWPSFVIVTAFTALFMFAAITDWIPQAIARHHATVIDWTTVDLFAGTAWSIYNHHMLLTCLVCLNILVPAICWRAACSRVLSNSTVAYAIMFVVIAGVVRFPSWHVLQASDRFAMIPMVFVLLLPLWLFAGRGVSLLVARRAAVHVS